MGCKLAVNCLGIGGGATTLRIRFLYIFSFVRDKEVAIYDMMDLDPFGQASWNFELNGNSIIRR